MPLGEEGPFEREEERGAPPQKDVILAPLACSA